MNKLLFRTDATPEIGVGHFMRCLALAQYAAKAGIETEWISYCPSPKLRRQIERLGAKPQWLEKTHTDMGIVAEAKPDLAVLDGYKFGLDCQKSIRSAGIKLLMIDDYHHQESYEADMILNQNIGSEAIDYKCNSGCVVLRGVEYCLIREEFLKARRKPMPEKEGPMKILLTMGGADPVNASLPIMQALELCKPDAEITVLVGDTNPRMDELLDFAGNASSNFKVSESVDNMPSLLSEMDFVISAAGLTCWELCLLGLPMALLVIAENQARTARGLERAGAAVHLGDVDNFDLGKTAGTLSRLISDHSGRERIASTAAKLVDGRGPERALRSIFQMTELDCEGQPR